MFSNQFEAVLELRLTMDSFLLLSSWLLSSSPRAWRMADLEGDSSFLRGGERGGAAWKLAPISEAKGCKSAALNGK